MATYTAITKKRLRGETGSLSYKLGTEFGLLGTLLSGVGATTNTLTITKETITLAGATAISLEGPTAISGAYPSGGALNVGTYAAPITMYNTTDKPTVMISGEVLADQASGTVKGFWVRSKISKEQSTNSVLGIEAQCRINGAAGAAATLGAGQFTGIWAYWEQSGTTALNTGNLSSAISCTVESATTLTIDSGAILAGVVIDSSVTSVAVNGTFDGIYIKKASGAIDFVSGIEMTDCVSSEVFKFADDATICNDTGATGTKGTATIGAFDGFVKIKIGDQETYLLTVNDPTASA